MRKHFRCLSTVLLYLGLTVINGAFATMEAPIPKAKQNVDGAWGLVVEGQGLASVKQPFPLQIEVWDEKTGTYMILRGAYRSFYTRHGRWIGRGVVKGAGNYGFSFEDQWSAAGPNLLLNRTVKVSGSFAGGFRSAATFEFTEPVRWPDVVWFSPGMIYGNFAHLRNNSYGAKNYYQPGNYAVWIREDRMPAPLMSARFADGSSVSVLNSAPNGATTHAEGNDFSHASRADARFQ